MHHLPEHWLQDEGKMNFQRSCRTDKHVSAARLVISFKMYELDNAVEIINSFLPKSVRVHDYVRTTKGFDCKKWASSRIYNYVVPSYCFQHKSAVNKQALQLFRVDETLKKRINEVLNHYHGTKNFHNFTSRKEGKDPSAIRYITSFKITDTFLWPDKCEDESVEQTEYLTLSVHGQSFMLHQIRKMIGLAMAVVRGNTEEIIYEKIFGNDKHDIPKAPSIGLYLENVFFEYYNKKFGTDGMHTPVKWDHCEDAVENFKREQIVCNILNDMRKEKVFEEYLPILDLHTYTTEIGHRLTRPDHVPNVTEVKTELDKVENDSVVLENETEKIVNNS
ncbi:pseudouridylate synthase 1 homolog isoform X2 [Symsagittifera roscoffensis]|uniref:pseudouridylate synthase 1 homolog isoform X2 n=1 Tax=Symsagittifera roscoffensis TaxID=84072 RepID=UPI00307BC9AE